MNFITESYVQNVCNVDSTEIIKRVENEIEIFSQTTFQDLINEHIQSSRCYVMAEVKNENSTYNYFDATNLIQNFQINNKIENPTTRQKIESIAFYLFTPNKEVFHYKAGFSLNNNKQTEFSKFLKHLLHHNDLDSNESNVKNPGKFQKKEAYLLGIYLEKNKDYQLAHFFYETAAQMGECDAKIRLAGLYEKGYGVTKDQAKATSLFLQATEQSEDAKLLLCVASRLEKGIGIEKNLPLAYEYYLRLAEKMDPLSPLAQYKVIEFLEKALIVAKNDYEVQLWRKKLPLELQHLPVSQLIRKFKN